MSARASVVPSSATTRAGVSGNLSTSADSTAPTNSRNAGTCPAEVRKRCGPIPSRAQRDDCRVPAFRGAWVRSSHGGAPVFRHTIKTATIGCLSSGCCPHPQSAANTVVKQRPRR
jgi:hypothetical protein